MAIVDETVSLDRETLARIQEELKKEGLDAWLLYNFHGNDPVTSRMLGLPAMTRRYFVLLPAEGDPIALTHRIEQQPWEGWIGENRPYLSWRELDSEVKRLLEGRGRVALEYSEGDSVPYVDLVPAGVMELIRSTGITPVSSADLVSAFYARWSPAGEASHRRAAVVLKEVAHAAFRRIGEMLRAGEEPNEYETRNWIAAELKRRGLKVDGDTIVAVNGNAANPHYAPTRERHQPIRLGDVVLIDLWGKEDEEAVFADQTWMGYVGTEVPERVQELWEAVRDARKAAVELVRTRWAAGEPVAGYEVDDATRNVIRERGYADHFIHRTGHSIDRELHGSGPNLDNLETRDTRRLIEGVGFSVEPGIYLTGDLGFRTEIDVFMGPDGPEVSPPEAQEEMVKIEV